MVIRTAIDLESSQLLASVKGCASRPNCWPTLDPVSALAVNCVEWPSEKCCKVQFMPEYSHYDWYSLGYVYISPIGWENIILYGEYVLNRNLVIT